MTSTNTGRCTGFDRVYDSPAGREILERLRRQPPRRPSTDPAAIDWTPADTQSHTTQAMGER